MAATSRYGLPSNSWTSGLCHGLLGFAKKADRHEIGRELGLGSPRLIVSASKSFNYLRNVSAHHSRLWNRSLTYQVESVSPELAPLLAHLADMTPSQSKKIYRPLAVLAHSTQHIPGVDNSFTRDVRSLVDTFPKTGGLSPELHMGFVPGWRDLDLWASR